MSERKSPIVFMKSGLEASEPLGFYPCLAEAFGADLHGTDAIRLEMSAPGTISFNRGVTFAVREEMDRRTAESLEAGRNVVYNGFLNVPERRQEVRDLAEEHGATPLILAIQTPISVVQERTKTRFDENLLPIPSDLSSLEDRLNVMQHMARALRKGGWPHRNPDEAGQTIALDGTKTNEALLATVRRELRRRGLN